VKVELGETAPDTLGSGRVIERIGEQRHDVVISAEVGEVLECKVDGAGERAGVAQLVQFVVLSLPAGHDLTMRPSADRSLPRG
jgi:hypothetical protein